MRSRLYNIYRIVRTIAVTLIVASVAIVALAYVLLNLPSVQDRVRRIGEAELSRLTTATVNIGDVDISPFNQVIAKDVAMIDPANGDTIARVDKVGAGVSLYNLILKRRIVFTFAEIIGLDARLKKATPESPLNIQFVIDALRSKDPNKPPTLYDVTLHNVVIRKSRLSYDIESEPQRPDGVFDPRHIAISDLKADIVLPQISNEHYDVRIKRLAFAERSGLQLTSLSAKLDIGAQRASVADLRVELPQSKLLIGPLSFTYPSLNRIGEGVKTATFPVRISESYVTPSDLRAIAPPLARLTDRLAIEADVDASLRHIAVKRLNISSANGELALDLAGAVSLPSEEQSFGFDAERLNVNATARYITALIRSFTIIPDATASMIERCGDVAVGGSGGGDLSAQRFAGRIATDLGTLDLDAATAQRGAVRSISGHVTTADFALGTLLAKPDLLANFAGEITVDGSITGRKPQGTVKANLAYFDFRGHRYDNISADVTATADTYSGTVVIDDDAAQLDLNGTATLAGPQSDFNFTCAATGIDLSPFTNAPIANGRQLTLDAVAQFTGNNLDNAVGDLTLRNLSLLDDNGNGLAYKQLVINASERDDGEREVNIDSDIITGSIVGQMHFASLPATIKEILSHAIPSIVAPGDDLAAQSQAGENDFVFDFTIHPDNQLTRFFKLPVTLIYPITVQGDMNTAERECNATISAPYLQQGNKLVENTIINAHLNQSLQLYTADVSTLFPLKTGNVALNVGLNAADDRIDTNLRWLMDKATTYKGEISASALLQRNIEHKLDALIDINPTQLIFNDTAWQVMPAKVEIAGGEVKFTNVGGNCGSQHLKIDGTLSHDPEKQLIVDLEQLSLDFLFEALDIDNVKFGGVATGKFYVSDAFSKFPKLSIPRLHVDGIAYNRCVIGDAEIESHWDPVTKGITLDADIKQANGDYAYIDGSIFPTLDSLYLDFNVKHTDVRFLLPYMAAFSSDITGKCSGHGTLFGKFSTINFEGDVAAENLRMKIDYTNVYYTTDDSVHIRPDLIDLNGITLRDDEGHTAKLNGVVTHDAFHDARFDIRITEADNLLCYDTDESFNGIWYGKVYGTGSAFLKGEPGLVAIDVGMRTEENSRFTFVLGSSTAAHEYDFITFRDRDAKPEPEPDPEPEIVQQLRRKVKAKESNPTQVLINLQVEATPASQVILVMDPSAGDRIRARGTGNLRMNYNSTDDELAMFGKYELEKGTYTFTFQDIIIKEFTIDRGSSIAFNGDPYTATLDIRALYNVNASLTDLDQSFAQDRDLNRTNVPVHAVLLASGDMRQPNIAFDLEFPTLTQEAVRRIKSIISTDDMMNRQIIYLVALNKFYTPEYMGGQSTNSEWANVASSTISSQLSNMLGQISENWTIAPNFRTQKGDFSDVEVDLALSSSLLNNRLLLNGNFGYRDKSLNAKSSSFIGDFDVEYLLTKNGSIRLRAYNRYNDQNYYIKNALTTQGVGVVFRHEFDRPFDFLKKRKKKAEATTPDSAATARPDSTAINNSENQLTH